MTRKTKGRAGWHQAARQTSNSIRDSTGLASRIKVAIVTMALWGLLPLGVLEWVIHRGGLRDD